MTNRLRVTRLLAGLRTPLGRRALRFGIAPSYIHRGVLRAIRPTRVIDVGANRGQFSLDVAATLDDVHVVAFEPLTTEAAVYRRIFEADNRFDLHEIAIGQSSGAAPMYVSAARDSSSLLSIGPLQEEMFPGTHAVGTELVEIRTLDEMSAALRVDSRTLLKLDVQGGELDVLRGAHEILRDVRWVYAELSFLEFYAHQPLATEVVAHLIERDFGLIHTGLPLVVDGRAVQVDALFERGSDQQRATRRRHRLG